MSPTPDSLPSPRSSVIFKEMDDGAVLYCTQSETYFGLNPVGVEVWRFLEGDSGTLQQLVESVRATFPDAPATQVESDVSEFVEELEGAGLLASSSIS